MLKSLKSLKNLKFEEFRVPCSVFRNLLSLFFVLLSDCLFPFCSPVCWLGLAISKSRIKKHTCK